MTPVGSLDSDQVFILLFLAAAGLASCTSHCFVRKYFLACLAASLLTSFFLVACAAAYILLSHLPLAKLSWLGMVYIPAFVCALPLSLIAGLPFLLLRRWTSPPQQENDKRIWHVPNGARTILTALLCAGCLLGVESLYNGIQREQIEETVYVAARNGTPADIQNAILMGGNVNVHLGYGTPPLMIAAFYGRTDNVAFLLKKGANPNVVCPRGETALKWAMQNKHYDVAALLRQAGEKE